MPSSSSFMLFAAMLTAGVPHRVSAQDEDALYVVTYIEALPSAAAQARELLAAYAEDSRRSAGNLQFDALQRIARSNHFAILEAWKDASAHAAHAHSPSAERFRASLTPLLYSPPDERNQRALLTGAHRDPEPGAVYVLTHVDVIPQNLERAVENLRTLTEASRSETGNLRFDVLVTNRGNHMTILEDWESAAAQEAHLSEPHTLTFRTNLSPLLGALYDDRLYRKL